MTIDRRTIMAAAGALGAAATSEAQASIFHPRPKAPPADTPDVAWYSGPPGAPKVGLRWVFTATVFFADRVMINSPNPRGYTSVAGGEVWGPRLQGRVLPHSGADYFRGTFNTHYFFEASDGALIYIHNRGTMRRFVAQPPPGEDPVPLPGFDPSQPAWTRFRATPIFDAPKGPHDWMNRTVFVANSQRQSKPDHTVFTYYEVI